MKSAPGPDFGHACSRLSLLVKLGFSRLFHNANYQKNSKNSNSSVSSVTQIWYIFIIIIYLVRKGTSTKKGNQAGSSAYACPCKLYSSSDWCESLWESVSESERESQPESERKRYRADVYSADVQFEKPVLDDRLADRQADGEWMLLYYFSFTALPITLVLQ